MKIYCSHMVLIMIRADEFNTIIEPYFDGGDSYKGHHKFSYIMQYKSEGDIVLSQQWDSGNIKIAAKGKGSLERRIYKSDISAFDSVTLKMSCPTDIRIRVFFDDVLVLDTFGTGKIGTSKAPISIKSVENIKYEVSNESEYDNSVGLYYLGVSREPLQNIPLYDGEWEGCIEENISFIPYDNDIMTTEKIDEINEKLDEEPYKSIYAEQKAIALKAMEKIPEKKISKMVYDGFRELINFCSEIEALSLVGLVEKNPDMIKMACRYALSMSACTYWGCDIMEEIPACVWHHRSFGEVVASRVTAATISLLGNSLTWHGRNVLYQAIIMKGLPRLEADFMTMDYIYKMNQGIAFMNGYLAALLTLSHQYPRYERRIDEAEELFYEMMEYAINPDGSTNEGAAYWEFTFLHAVGSVSTLYKRKKPVNKKIKEIFKKTSDFGLFMHDDAGNTLPINDCKGGHISPYLSKYFYILTGDERWAYLYHKSDLASSSREDILTDVEIPDVNVKISKEFESFDDAGFVAVCRDGIRLICVSGESNSTHCHADKGSFLLYSDGKALLTDRGSLPYNLAGVNLIYDSEFHNCAVPFVNGKAITQKKRDGLKADFKYEYKDGIFTWTSDQTMLWDNSLVKKNTRTIYSDTADKFIVTDEFEFTSPTAVGVFFQRTDETSLKISTLSEYKDIESCVEEIGDKKIYKLSYITEENMSVKFVSEIVVVR